MSASPRRVRPTRVTIPQHVVFRAFVEETVVLNLESGRYHGLNPTAGRMLELLGELGDVDAVARRIAERPAPRRARGRRPASSFCSSLAERGLIEVEPALERGRPARAVGLRFTGDALPGLIAGVEDELPRRHGRARPTPGASTSAGRAPRRRS